VSTLYGRGGERVPAREERQAGACCCVCFGQHTSASTVLSAPKWTVKSQNGASGAAVSPAPASPSIGPASGAHAFRNGSGGKAKPAAEDGEKVGGGV